MIEFIKEKKAILYHFFAGAFLVPLIVFIGASAYNAAIGTIGLGFMYKLYLVLNKKSEVKQAAADLVPVLFGVGAGILLSLI